MKKVIVIGAGVGGLATAALLSKKGYKVVVLEKNDRIGGRAMVLKESGFTFDMGPSWYLLPEIFENFFALFNKKVSDFYTLIKLDPSYRIFFSANEVYDLKSDLEKNKRIFEKLEPGSFDKLKKLLVIAKDQYDVSVKYFINKNFSFKDLFSFNVIKNSRKLVIFQSLESFINKFFITEKVKRILLYTVLFLGGMPNKTPALFSMMNYIDYKLGVWYPKGGIGKVTKALHKLGLENGVEYIFNADVTKIITENKIATAVEYNNKTINADIVVSNADYAFTETTLLNSESSTYKSKFWNKKLLAPSAFVIYLGVNKKIKGLIHHNVFISENWNQHFKGDILSNPKLPENPSIYVSCTSKTDSNVAPANSESIFITVPIAAELEIDEKQKEAYKAKVIKIIETYLNENISDSIVFSKVITVNDYKNLYNAYKGTALGLAPTLFQSAFFRPSNKSKKVNNLYYVGQYTNPGAGVPMCLLSAQLVVDRIENA